MSWVFPAEPTVVAGSDLVLHVSTRAPAFRVALHRFEARPSCQAVSEVFPGQHRPPHLPHQDWGEDSVGLDGRALPGWPGYHIPIPADWPPGVYLAVVETGPPTRHLARPDARSGQALFVVRGPAGRRRAPMLYKLPLFTYHAYNQVSARGYDPRTGDGGWCLYTVPHLADGPRAVPPAVSVRRPGGGTGGTPWDLHNRDPFDPTPRQTFVHWDAPFLRWLARTGYAADVCTDLDLHREGVDLLAGYRLLLSAGHDEYWSSAMRSGVADFLTGGGNVAIFSGNTCWWHVELDDETRFQRLHPWSDPACGRPENELIGVSFRNGGERDNDEHPTPVGYTVQHADSWVYAGTGLRDGAVIGGRRTEYVVGYECDGALFDRQDLAAGRPVVPTGEDGTPQSYTILGIADLAPSGWGHGNAAATMGLYRRGGTVFNAATTDWPRVLAAGRSPAIEQITANVLDRLGST